jgi:O-antigen ligase
LKYYERIKENLNFYAFILLVFSLPLDDRIVSLTILIWALTALLQGDYKISLSQFKHKYLYFALLFYFLLICIWLFFSDDKIYALQHIETNLSLVLFPFLFIISSDKIVKNIHLVFIAFILGNLLASFYCYLHAFYTNISVVQGQWNLRISFYEEFNHLSFWELVNRRICTFSYVFLSELKHSTYFAMYIVYSMCMIFYLYKRLKRKSAKIKILLIFLFLYFIFFLYLLQSRAGLVSLIIVGFIIIFNELYQSRRKTYFLILGVALVTGLILIFSSTKLLHVIDQTGNLLLKPDKSQIEGENDRFQMWYSILPVIKENFLTGVGPASVTDELMVQYAKNNFEIAIQYRLNAHNQYLETVAGIGIPGLLILIFILFYPLLFSIQSRNYLLFFLIFLLSFNFMFESMLNRMAGIIFMMVFTGIFLFTKDLKSV